MAANFCSAGDILGVFMYCLSAEFNTETIQSVG